MKPKIKIGVHVFLTEDDRVGVQCTTQNNLTAVGLLLKGIQLLQGPVEAPKEESNLVIPRVSL